MQDKIITKVCSKCKRQKDVHRFNKDKSAKDGLDHKCKSCKCAYRKEYAKTDKARKLKKLSDKRYANTKNGKAVRKKARDNYYHSDKGIAYTRAYNKQRPPLCPLKMNARNAINALVRAGKMPPASKCKCSNCTEQARHYHHHKGYEPENKLEVVPLCTICHKQIHSISPKEAV